MDFCVYRRSIVVEICWAKPLRLADELISSLDAFRQVEALDRD